jgi:cell fate (sporulation/competence/biofilm development) regulator YmcA (YheA/YmcA/DUF963 family)
MEKKFNDIKEDINNMFDEFEETNLYKSYLSVKEQLEKNEEINNIIKDIRRLQKIATNNKDSVIEKELKELYKKLESYPLYQSYLIIKEELNNELFMISNQFDKYFNELLKLD